MTAKGHMMLASSATLGLYSFSLIDTALLETINIMSPSSSIMFYIAVIVGSLLPDIDESESYIGNKLKIISILMSSLFKHRTFTHYLITPLTIVMVAFFIDDVNMQIILFGLSAGILLHDVGDMLTKGGIKGFFFPFFPSSKIALLPEIIRFKTFSIQEYMLIYFLLMPLNAYLVYLLYMNDFWRIF